MSRTTAAHTLLLLGSACYPNKAGAADGEADLKAFVDTDTGSPEDCWVGDYTIHHNDDVEALDLYSCVTGSVLVDAPGLTVLDLPNLVWTGSGVIISDQSGLTSVRLEALNWAGEDGLTVSGNSALTALDLRSLATLATGTCTLPSQSRITSP